MLSRKFKASAVSYILPARSRSAESGKIQTISRAREDVRHGQEIENKETSEILQQRSEINSSWTPFI